MSKGQNGIELFKKKVKLKKYLKYTNSLPLILSIVITNKSFKTILLPSSK